MFVCSVQVEGGKGASVRGGGLMSVPHEGQFRMKASDKQLCFLRFFISSDLSNEVTNREL